MRVSEEMQYIYPELANEFYTVVMQVRAGQERGMAFNQFVRRTGIEDIKTLAAMIIQSEKFGTSLAQALKVYADALRTRRRLRAEAAVGKAGIKMLFPIVRLHSAGAVRDHAGAGYAERAERSEDAGRRAVDVRPDINVRWWRDGFVENILVTFAMPSIDRTFMSGLGALRGAYADSSLFQDGTRGLREDRNEGLKNGSSC